MKNLDANCYVEVKDHRDKSHPTENFFLRKQDPPTFLRTHYQVQNNTQKRKNQKVIENDNDVIVVKKYPKNKKQPIEQSEFTPPKCPSCKRNKWLVFDIGYYCRNCEDIINKQKHQIDKKFHRQDHYY